MAFIQRRRYATLSYTCVSLLLAVSIVCCSSSMGRRSVTGSTPARSFDLDGPTSLAIEDGILYILELGKPQIRRLDLKTGTISTLNTSRPLEVPDQLAVDHHGGLLVAEMARVVRVSTSDGTVTTVAGTGDFGDSGDGGLALQAHLSSVSGLAIDALGGIYVADWRVRRIDARTGVITSIAGAQLRGANHKPTTGDGGPALSAGLDYLDSVAVDTRGNVYIAQFGEYADGHRIRRVDAVTGVIETIVGPGTHVDVDPSIAGTPWRIQNPGELTWDRTGGLLFLDPVNGRVLRLDVASRSVRAIAGSSRGNSGDGGPATQARFKNPSGLAVDDDGNIFVADFAANRVRRIDQKTGKVRTVVGTGRVSAEPMIIDSQPVYPSPEAETCQNEITKPALIVDAVDQAGGPIPEATVVMVTIASASEVSSWQTDAAGRAILTAPRSGNYAVMVSAPGFLPETRALRLSSGCSGKFSAILKIAPVK